MNRSSTVKVTLREEGGERSAQEILVWLLSRGHQGNGEELQGGTSGGLCKLHPGGSLHGGHGRDGDDAGMRRHSSIGMAVVHASSLLQRELDSIFGFLVDRLAHLALRFEQGEVVCRAALNGRDREELQGSSGEVGRGPRRAGREGVGGA